MLDKDNWKRRKRVERGIGLKVTGGLGVFRVSTLFARMRTFAVAADKAAGGASW
jgi:hypothetical protein